MNKILLLFILMLVAGCDDESSTEASLKCAKSLNIETSSDSDFEDVLPYCKEAAEKGSAQAQLNLGYMYLYGKAVEQNKSAAIEWLNKAADNGSLEAKAVLISVPRHDVDVFYTCQVGDEHLFSQYAVNDSCIKKRTLGNEWKNVYFTKDYVVDYNFKTVVGSHDQKKVWWELFSSKQNSPEDLNSAAPIAESIKHNYTKFLTNYYCNSREQEPIKTQNYEDDKIISSVNNGPKMQIDPDTFSDMVFRKVCNKN